MRASIFSRSFFFQVKQLGSHQICNREEYREAREEKEVMVDSDNGEERRTPIIHCLEAERQATKKEIEILDTKSRYYYLADGVR